MNKEEKMFVERWDPFRELTSIENQFNRMFGFNRKRWAALDSSPNRNWKPNVDIFESENELVLKAELPGINPDDVELNIEKNVLVIRGERKLENDKLIEDYHRIERAYGVFNRSIVLPTSIKEDEVSAEFKDGLLTVTIPKQETAKARQIKIAS